MRRLALLATLILPACADDQGDDSTSTSTGDEDTTTSGSTSAASTTTSTSGSTSTSSTSTTSDTTTGEASNSTTAEASSSTTGDDTSTSSGTTGEPDPFCGDGGVDQAEDCDDGNAVDGDGCDADCTFSQWRHLGLAKDVAVADLHGWELCWSGTYEGTAGSPATAPADLPALCDAAEVLVVCGKTGSGILHVAGHGTHDYVFWESGIDPNNDEWVTDNMIKWAWGLDFSGSPFVMKTLDGPFPPPVDDDDILWWAANATKWSSGRCGSAPLEGGPWSWTRAVYVSTKG